MHQKDLIPFNGLFVAIGISCYSRTAPFFFYGELLEINEANILLKLDKNSGLKSIRIAEIVDIHLDPKYNNINRRKNRH